MGLLCNTLDTQQGLRTDSRISVTGCGKSLSLFLKREEPIKRFVLPRNANRPVVH